MADKKTYVPVKIQDDVFRLMEAVASVRGVNVADYLSDIVRPIAESDYAKLHQLFSKMRYTDVHPPQ
jgi:hypothetical protein